MSAVVEEIGLDEFAAVLRDWKAATRAGCAKRGVEYNREVEWQKEREYWSLAATYRPELHP